MLAQFGKHAYQPSRWRAKHLAVLWVLCVMVLFVHIHVLRPTLHLLLHTHSCSASHAAAGSSPPPPPLPRTGGNHDDATPVNRLGLGGKGGGRNDDAAASSSGSSSAIADPAPLIPPKIWQNHFRDEVEEDNLKDMASWPTRNKDHAYTLVGMDGANRFVDRHFGQSEPALAQAYHALPNFGMKSDLLRYLVLWVEGGVYSDIDTEALRPVREWVPAPWRRLARAVVGIEFDRRDGGQWVDIFHDLQFCQWTLAAAPGHPLFREMADRALASLERLAAAHSDPEQSRDSDNATTTPAGASTSTTTTTDTVAARLATLRPTNAEVLSTTGPAAWTEAVFAHLRRHNPALTSLTNFSYMTEPRLYGDVLVLPIDGFGMGQAHSGSTDDGSVPEQALVKHNFRGRWRAME